MRDERGESVGVSGVPTPLAALFICSCFLCFVKTRRRKFWDVPLLYVLYIYGHILFICSCFLCFVKTRRSSGTYHCCTCCIYTAIYTRYCCIRGRIRVAAAAAILLLWTTSYALTICIYVAAVRTRIMVNLLELSSALLRMYE